ncbi:GAF domain-containing SpoIIE family protein phosphatase [Streptomyces sp. NPDC046985]|uniref:GAF domain-containing SpoIIE family protein phosphatase n=1 Tax=Streptomyces sp. NPDC046985 TaxID=3155377 RepID=UPI003409E010
MKGFDGLARSAPGLAASVGASWMRAPYPALVADAAGRIVEVNAQAAALFPEARPGARLEDAAPEWLAAAHRRAASGPADATETAETARGQYREHTLEAHATRGTGGDVVWWLVDDTDRTLAEAALRSEQERTAFLADASSRLLASLNAERCMEIAVELAAEHLADAAVLVAPASGKRHPLATSAGGQATRRLMHIDPSMVPGLAEALQGFPPVPSRWIDPSSLPAWAIPDDFTGPAGSVVVTPLPGHGLPAGALILLRRGGQTAFDASEEVFARVFASRAGAALSAARMYQEQSGITATLMAELLPPVLHQVRGVEFAGGYRSSRDAERVSGDFYDVHPGSGDDEETLAVLGDVSGKGLDAAVLTGKIRNTLQALLPLAGDHQRLLSLLNGALINSRHTRFATVVLASVRRRGGATRLRLTSAGHPAPLIVRQDGSVEEAATAGTLIGALPEIRSSTAEETLRPGETCLLYTDGVTEAKGGPLGDALFGDARLRRALGECAGMPAEAVVERIQMVVADWIDGNRHDDIAIMAITAPRTAHLTAVDGRTPGRYTA